MRISIDMFDAVVCTTVAKIAQGVEEIDNDYITSAAEANKRKKRLLIGIAALDEAREAMRKAVKDCDVLLGRWVE